MNRIILHIAQRAHWLRAAGEGSYRCASLDDEGFVHCSSPEQVLVPANERFRGREDLVLLCIEVERLDCDLRYEDCDDSGMVFPHVYGPIGLAAVVAVVDFPPGDDGLFELPSGLA